MNYQLPDDYNAPWNDGEPDEVESGVILEFQFDDRSTLQVTDDDIVCTYPRRNKHTFTADHARDEVIQDDMREPHEIKQYLMRKYYNGKVIFERK